MTVLLAGCSGWGSDGPAEEGAEPDGTDDLEEADTEAGDGDDEVDDSATDEDADGDEQPPTDTDDGDEADADDGAQTGEDEPEADDGDEGADADDAGEGDDGEATDGSALAVETADVVTGDPVNADVIALERGGETVDEASGTSATFDGLDDGEYELEIYNDLGNWVYADTITIDGEDETYVAEIDQGHTYWPAVEAAVVDADGEPVEGETVTINGQSFETGPDGTVIEEIESNYTDEREFVVEYGDRSETVEVDWESWDGEPETVTFEVQNAGNAALTITA